MIQLLETRNDGNWSYQRVQQSVPRECSNRLADAVQIRVLFGHYSLISLFISLGNSSELNISRAQGSKHLLKTKEYFLPEILVSLKITRLSRQPDLIVIGTPWGTKSSQNPQCSFVISSINPWRSVKEDFVPTSVSFCICEVILYSPVIFLFLQTLTQIGKVEQYSYLYVLTDPFHLPSYFPDCRALLLWYKLKLLVAMH